MPSCVAIFKRFTTPETPSGGVKFRRGEWVNTFDMDDLPDGCREKDTDRFLRYNITDKSASEVTSYLERWNRELIFEVVNGPDPVTGFRRVKVTNQKINQSQNIGGWTEEQATAIVDAWNASPTLNKLYPEPNLVTVGFTAKDLLQEGEFTDGQAQAYQDLVYDVGTAILDRQRVWSLTEAACQAFESTGGVKTGTASQLESSLQNGIDT